MAALTSDEAQKSRRRRRLVQGLLIGGAAVGIPALMNLWVRRGAGTPPPPPGGRLHHFAWRHGEIAFQQQGEGPPVVLVHSLGPGNSGAQWYRAAEILGAERRVYIPDLLGWGRSQRPRMTYDAELYIRLLTDFLEDVVRRRAVVVAAGLPAAYAMQAAVDRPELISALGLVVPLGLDAHADEPDLKDALLHRLLRLPVLGTSALNLYASRAGITHQLRHEVYAAPERVDAALVDRHYRLSHAPGAYAPLAAYLAGYLNHGAASALGRLAIPVWLAWGRQAKSPPVESADLWLSQTKRAELDVFEGCGLLPHAESPAAFCRRLRHFLITHAADDIPG